jgi:hypothetical protein
MTERRPSLLARIAGDQRILANCFQRRICAGRNAPCRGASPEVGADVKPAALLQEAGWRLPCSAGICSGTDGLLISFRGHCGYSDTETAPRQESCMRVVARWCASTSHWNLCVAKRKGHA